jgi:hypothetical protein
MNQTQSIIVYRNPVEQAFWEGFMNSSAVIPILFGMVAFFVSLIILDKITRMVFRKTKIVPWRSGYDLPANISLALAAVIGIGTVYLTWI